MKQLIAAACLAVLVSTGIVVYDRLDIGGDEARCMATGAEFNAALKKSLRIASTRPDLVAAMEECSAKLGDGWAADIL